MTDVLQRLIRFNTVNPPGHERPAAEYLATYLSDAGIEVDLIAATEDRPNLVANVRGSQDGPTLCLSGHLDTVLATREAGITTHGQARPTTTSCGAVEHLT